MKNFELIPTRSSPLVRIDLNTNEFLIEGRSMPEKGVIFYENIVKWMKRNMTSNNYQIQLRLELQYCNTSSYKGLLLLFTAIKELNDRGNSISVKWVYEYDDEDWLEDGKTFEEALNIPFVFEAVK